nr:hypothetical protein [Amycolatopsis nivea]
MNGLVDRLNRHRGKPIRLMRGDLSGTMPTGLLLRTEAADYIVVIRDVQRGHARHIHFHELGHILLEDADLAGPCLPQADPRARAADELMAEEFAHQLAERIDAHPCAGTGAETIPPLRRWARPSRRGRTCAA